MTSMQWKRNGSGNDIVYDSAVLSQATKYARNNIINQYQVQLLRRGNNAI